MKEGSMSEETRPEELTLLNVAGGAAAELFQNELQSVLANIANVNTSASAKREIRLTFAFTPNEARDAADVQIAVATRLASTIGGETKVYMGRSQGRHFAVEHNPRQLLMQLERPAEIVAIDRGGER
jgi:hypothetical protein